MLRKYTTARAPCQKGEARLAPEAVWCYGDLLELFLMRHRSGRPAV